MHSRKGFTHRDASADKPTGALVDSSTHVILNNSTG